MAVACILSWLIVYTVEPPIYRYSAGSKFEFMHAPPTCNDSKVTCLPGEGCSSSYRNKTCEMLCIGYNTRWRSLRTAGLRQCNHRREKLTAGSRLCSINHRQYKLLVFDSSHWWWFCLDCTVILLERERCFQVLSLREECISRLRIWDLSIWLVRVWRPWYYSILSLNRRFNCMIRDLLWLGCIHLPVSLQPNICGISTYHDIFQLN
jgi:hypothetical protein